MKKLTIKSDRVVTKVVIESDYKVLRGFITKNITSKKICLVYDKNATACMTEVKESLKGYDVIETSYGEGESVKTAENLLALCELLCDNEFTRGDALIAVGGGAVSDLVGFAASLYKRGIKYLNCPTTLLSAIDASVGGKTAVDFGGGKNVLGEFYAPAAVYVSLSALKSLPEKDIRSGKGEVAKYALLSAKITEAEVAGEITEDLIYKCLLVKKKYVEKDEYDLKDRKILNLGHTAGHAIEAESGFTLSHGECVARGLYKVIAASAKKYNLKPEIVYDMNEMVRAAGFGDEYKAELPMRKLSEDKKTDNGKIDIILLKKIGKPKIESVSVEKAESIFQ